MNQKSKPSSVTTSIYFSSGLYKFSRTEALFILFEGINTCRRYKFYKLNFECVQISLCCIFLFDKLLYVEETLLQLPCKAPLFCLLWEMLNSKAYHYGKKFSQLRWKAFQLLDLLWLKDSIGMLSLVSHLSRLQSILWRLRQYHQLGEPLHRSLVSLW